MTHSAGLWNVSTMSEYGALTVRFLRGELDETPHHGGPLDPESAQLVDALIAANELGLVTSESQPGQPMLDGSGQRAYVVGMCEEESVNRLRAGLLGSDLVLIVQGPGGESTAQINATLAEGEETLWLGGGSHSHEIEIAEEMGGSKLANLVARAWLVEIFDPAWGRNDRLWPTIVEALRAQR